MGTLFRVKDLLSVKNNDYVIFNSKERIKESQRGDKLTKFIHLKDWLRDLRLGKRLAYHIFFSLYFKVNIEYLNEKFYTIIIDSKLASALIKTKKLVKYAKKALVRKGVKDGKELLLNFNRGMLDITIALGLVDKSLIGYIQKTLVNFYILQGEADEEIYYTLEARINKFTEYRTAEVPKNYLTKEIKEILSRIGV